MSLFFLKMYHKNFNLLYKFKDLFINVTVECYKLIIILITLRLCLFKLLIEA